MIETPWSNNNRSRQVDGRVSEVKQAKHHGVRLHPNSGAGHIKDDGSNEDVIIEFKDAQKSHTLKGVDLDGLFRRAVRQGKEAKYIILFRDTELEAVVTLSRRKI